MYKQFELQGFRIRAVPVRHPVQSVGYLLEKNGVTIAFSGDTGPTDELWRTINGYKNVKAIFCELSFPNKLQWLADLSGHFTPQSLMKELKKLDRRDAQLYLFHLKPSFIDDLNAAGAALKQDHLPICALNGQHQF